MKKIIFFVLILMAFLALPLPALAGNKIGIHIGDQFDKFNQAANVVQGGGWIVVMGCPGDAQKIQELMNQRPDVNIIIRGHYPSQKLDKNWALAWVGTLGNLQTANKIFFMPWNEPNQAGTSDYGSPSEVKKYIDDLSSLLAEAGLRGGKVKLLSPSINQSHHNASSYISGLGAGSFFNQFDGIAISLYDFGEEICGAPLCSDDPHLNPARFKQVLSEMGASGKSVYGVESGIAGKNFYWKKPPTSNSPLYRFVSQMQHIDVKMFAIPAYDLAGEAGHRWSLFSPADTINLMRDLSSPSSPESGSSDWNQGFITSHGLITCPNGITVAPNESFCSGCAGTFAEEFIYPQNSLVCTNFEIKKKSTSEALDPIPAEPAEVLADSDSNEITGNLKLKEFKFPDFSVMTDNLDVALSKLLPSRLKKEVYIDATPLETKTKHFVFGTNKEGELIAAEEIPETDSEQPAWFSQLLGQSKILCGLTNVCEPPKSLAIKVAQPDIETLALNPETECGRGQDILGEAANLLAYKEPFRTQTFWEKTIETLRKFIEDIGIWRTGTKTTKETKLVDKSRGALIGGKTLLEQDSSSTFIPNAYLSKDNEPLKNPAEFEVKESDGGDFELKEGSDRLDFQEQEKIRQDFCRSRCYLYPNRFAVNIDELYEICSCQASDY